MQFAPAMLLLVLVALGLTITFTSLNKDIRSKMRKGRRIPTNPLRMRRENERGTHERLC